MPVRLVRASLLSELANCLQLLTLVAQQHQVEISVTVSLVVLVCTENVSMLKRQNEIVNMVNIRMSATVTLEDPLLKSHAVGWCCISLIPQSLT